MNKLALISTIVAFMMATGLLAQDNNADVTSVAQKVIKAYQNRDLNLLKDNASGMLKMVLNSTGDSYFDDKEMQDILNVVDQWDGKIRGVGYEIQNIMGKSMEMASVYFADGQKEGEIWEVLLVKTGDNPWLAFGDGISTDTKEEFDKLLPSLKVETQKSAAPSKDISIEMANGDTFEHASLNTALSNFEKMDDDNFFIILNNKENFMQAAYSDKGYTVEYKENGTQYEAKELLPKEKTIELIKDYFNTDSKWKTDVEWEEM